MNMVCWELKLFRYNFLTQAESIRLYTIAMKAGDIEAMLGMAGWHMTGADGILAKSEIRAFQLVKHAAEKGLPRAEYTLGYFYEGGIGVEKNVDLGFQYYYKAAEKGNCPLIVGEERAISRIQRSDPEAKFFARKTSKKKKQSFFGGLFGKG
jgi:uncharacterized protein